MVEMPFSKAFCSIKRINPYNHLLLIKLIWEFVEVPVCIGSLLSVDLFHLSQVLSVSYPMYFVVLQEHLLRDVVLVDLIWLYVRLEKGEAFIATVLLS
jgi:hypothetical protein